jgi:sugar phosphate isomerase/epimerase
VRPRGRRRRLRSPDDSNEPLFSISQISTFAASFEDDLRAYTDAGADGIGVWEIKLPDGGDAGALEALQDSGLGSASAVPAIPSILPLPQLEGPSDPRERVDAICGSLHRLAPFRPTGIVCLTGSGVGRDPAEARRIVVDGLREIAAEAESVGLRVALEPYQREGGEDWTIVSSIPEAVELIEAAGDAPSLGILFDVWHLWNTETLLDDIAREHHRFVGVHVNDYRTPTRGWADRVMPGEGAADVPAILGALDEAGWDSYYDLEIFSDNGTFGSAYHDSLWDIPADELARRGREAFSTQWQARKLSGSRAGPIGRSTL